LLTCLPAGRCANLRIANERKEYLSSTHMTELETRLKTIQDKLQQLLKQHTSLQKENQKLKEELSLAQGQSSQHKKNMDELKQQVSVLKLGAGEMSDADKKEFEKRINTYIREIDRCIAMISG
jgi:septal ring factor EnvC (AmiA/AmiB activator)